MDRSDGGVTAVPSASATSVSRRDSSTSGATTRSSSSNGTASSTRQSGSSSANAGASNSHTSSSSSSYRSSGAGAEKSSSSSSHSLSRRNSGNEGSSSSSSARDRETRDSRDHHRDSRDSNSRDSRHSRDRDSRDSRSTQRGRSRSRESSRDYRDRDRGSSSSSHNNSQSHFGASGNPVVRLRERNNILVMHRTATRRSNLTPAEVAQRVYGLDTQFMKDTDNPNISEKLGPPGLFPTNMNLPEEKFRLHASRGTAFVNPLPRGFGTNWHLQYSFFTNKKFPVFDEVAQAANVIDRMEPVQDDASSSAGTSATQAAQVDHAFATYLIRNVRRIDERISHQWMSELASGKKTIPELVQSFGVPFKQWRPVPNVSKCPLLEYVVRYRPGFAEATWFIQINVVYVEMNEIKRDSTYRQGDWFHNPRRIQRRALGWTEQLVDYMHSLARQSGKTSRNETDTVENGNMIGSKDFSNFKSHVVNRRHGDMGLGVGSSGSTLAQSGSSTPSQLSFHEKWSYLLKLSEYQFKMGLLDRSRYFDGLLSMLQKALTPRRRSGNSSTVLILSVNDIMELISVLQNLLDDLLLCTEGVILLVKTVVQHLRYLLPPGSKIPSEPLSSPLQEDLVVSLCQILRGILLNAHDVLVRLEDNGPHTWPAFVLSNRFYDRSVFSEEEIDSCVKRCRQLSAEVSGRILRVQQLCSQSFHHASQRNEVQLIQCLDRFHRVDATVDLARVYNEVFAQMPVSPVLHELPVDVSAVFLVCEWAVTSHRPAEYRYLTAVSLLEMHSSALLDFGKENGLLRCSTIDHQVVLQGALQSFLQRYKPKMISEVTQLIDMFCLLVRRRLFSVDSFVEFAACMIESTADEVPAPAPVMSPNGNRIPASSSSANPTSATIVSTAYNIECAPGRGYKSSDIPLLTTAERLRLYLWQLPRGPTPLPTSVPMIPDEFYDPELSLLRWLDVMELRREHLSHSKTLERAQSLCVFVFHTHGEVNDPNDPSNKDRVMKEVDYQGKVGELVSAVKTMCGHDKGRFTTWFLKSIYEETSFFRFSELGSVEHIVRLVCLVLEIVDILALMEVIVFFLRRSPASLVKNVVVTMIERHEIVFWSTGQILLLMKTFVDRFKMMPKSIADDKNHSVAKFFCVLYNAHAKQKEIEKLDLPVPLLHAIAQALRKNQDGNQKQKELSLEASNIIARIPPPRETIPPEVKSALSRSFKALQSRNFADGTGTDAKPQTVSTPLASPDSQGGQTATEPSYEAPVFSSMVWREVVIEASEASESKCRDGAIDYAATAINMSMSASVGATNANATRERKTPNYVFFLRAVLSEIMDKWMASVMARTKHNYRRPIMTPHYVHRCVRLIREIMEQHPDGEDFQEKFTNTLVVWLQKEVLPGFAGSESQRRVRNPFINMENGREAFVMNQKGRLDKLQYGLKAFLVSLIVHKVLDLTQVLRLVLVPLFPRLRRASRDPPPNLPSQLLAMALVYQLFSEPPQNVVLDAQKIVMFDEPMTKYHLRHLRTQVPAGLMFPLVHLLCQISYQMEEENFTLRRREERGTLASYALFNLTSDGIVRDIIFHDTKEAREKHILPVYQKKQWHTAVLLTHFFRPPNSPAEDQNGQVQLLKVEQIIDQMNVWVLNRGGSIYLDLQMSRQQQKAKRAVKSSSRQSAKRQATNDNSTRPAKRRRGTHNVEEPMLVTGYLDPASSDDEEDIEIDESSSATETLANLIVLRTLRKASRPPALHHSTSLYSVSPIPTPHLFTPVPVAGIHDESPHYVVCSSSSRWKHPFVNHNMHPGALTDAEISASVAAHEAQEASVASLYAATVCSISRRTMGSVIAKILQVLEDDVKSPLAEKHSGQNVNGTTVVRLISGVMCTPPGAAFLPRYMMSVATQLESLFEACSAVDQSDCADASAVKRLRRKLAVRLQLVAVVCQNKHIAPTICYRNRIVKTLFYLLGTSTTSQGSGLSLFSWILDLIPLVNGAVLHDKHFELVASLNLPDDLKRRVWTIFPRPTSGADAVYLRSAKQAFRPVDPWGLLDHVSPLPSDDVILMPQVVQPKRRRVFRCA